MMNAFKFDEWLHRKLSPKNKSSFSYLTVGKITLRYFDSGGDKPVLFTAPDGPCFIEHFEGYIERAKENWRVVIMDMPGFGESYPGGGYDHSFERATQVFKALIDHLGLSRFTLSLSCANGFYGLHFAKHYPELVEKLVLIQTPGYDGMRPWLEASVPNPVKVPFVGQLLVYGQRLKLPKIWFKMALPKHSPHVQPWSELSVKRVEESCCNCLASVVQGLSRMTEESLTGVTVPTVMIWGKKDFSHRFTDEQSLKKVVPHATILVWEDCGHFPELEQTERFFELLES